MRPHRIVVLLLLLGTLQSAALHAPARTSAQTPVPEACRAVPAAIAAGEGLTAVGLQDSDLPGFERIDAHVSTTPSADVPFGACAISDSAWASLTDAPPPIAAYLLLSFSSVETAHRVFARAVKTGSLAEQPAGQVDLPDQVEQTPLGSQGVGEESLALFTRYGDGRIVSNVLMVLFRRGPVLGGIVEAGTSADDRLCLADVVALAQLVDGRVSAIVQDLPAPDEEQ